jgi:hypothetical protein
VSKNNPADYFSPLEKRSMEPRPRPRLSISYELSIARLRTRDWPKEDGFYSEPKLKGSSPTERTKIRPTHPMPKVQGSGSRLDG